MATTSSSPSARCAFCGATVRDASARILVAFAAPTERDRGTCTEVKPLKWRFLTNKGPCTKFMCIACAEKRKVHLQVDRHRLHHCHLPATVESWKPERARKVDRFPQSLQREEEEGTTSKAPKPMKVETRESCRQPHNRLPHCMLQSAQEKHQAQRRERQPHSQHNIEEQPTLGNRRRRATHTFNSQLEGGRRGSAFQSFAGDRVARKSMTQTWPSSPVAVQSPPSVTHRRASMTEGATCGPRTSSSGQSEPRKCEKQGQRLSSTADILGMTRTLDLPPHYFEMSSASPKLYAKDPPGQDPLDWERVDLDVPHVDVEKQRESDEERHRRRSASYAHMLLRMRLHYNTVQVNGKHACPASAPPRRIRSERAQSVAVRNVRSDTISRETTNFAIDLGYLHAYKDAR